MKKGVLVCKKYIPLNQGGNKELQVTQTLRAHPHIIKLLDYKLNKKRAILYVECHSQTLLDVILQGVDIPQIKKMLAQLAVALQSIHDLGYVHRNISGENVLIDSHNDVVISNFSSAMSYRASNQERYSFPDVPRQISPDGPEFDIWSLGVCLLMLVTSSFPFGNIPSEIDIFLHTEEIQSSLRLLLQDLDPLLQDLLLGMLEIDPQKRIKLSGILSHPWLADYESQLIAQHHNASQEAPDKQKDSHKASKKYHSCDIGGRITRQVIKALSSNLLRQR